MFTSGIGYLKVLFDTNRVPAEDLPYVGLLKSVLGYVNTKEHTYSDLASEIYFKQRRNQPERDVVPEPGRTGKVYRGIHGQRQSSLRKAGFRFSLIGEMLADSILDDEKRLSEIVAEMKSRSQAKLNSAAHSAAVARATSYFRQPSAFNDITGGIASLSVPGGILQGILRTEKQF